MKHLNQRIYKLVDILLQESDYITVNDLCEKLDVSNKTVRNDLDQIEQWIQDGNLRLNKKTGVGIRIEGSEQDKLVLRSTIQKQSNKMRDYSPIMRRHYIGMQLTIHRQVHISDMAKELYVSRATIYKDIEELMIQSEGFKAYIKRNANNALSLEGKEKNIRNFMVELMIMDNGYDVLIEMIRNKKFQCDGSLVFLGLEVSDDELQDFVNCILSSKLEYLKVLNFQSLILLMVRMFSAFLRINDGNIIYLSDQFLGDLKQKPLFKEARFVTDRIENHFNIQVPSVETRYLQVYLLALQKPQDFTGDDKAWYFTEFLVGMWSESLSYDFSLDDTLVRHVYEHLRPALIRFQHGIIRENPILKDIKSSFGNTFEIVKQSTKEIESYYDVKLSDDDIAYLTLHLAASLEQQRKPLNTLLVCHSGVGASTLIETKLAMQVPELKIVRTENYMSFDMTMLEPYDLLIVTLPLAENPTIPYLRISSLLTDYDIKRVRETVRVLYKQKNDPLNHKV